MQNYVNSVAYDNGVVAPNASVSVYLTGTTTLATIYASNSTSGATKANPLTTDSNGSYSFYAPNGPYDISITAGSTTISLLRQVLFDPNTIIPTGIDDTSALQAAFSLGTAVSLQPNGYYRISQPLTLAAGCQVTGNGATIDQTAIASGNLFGLQASGSLGTGVALAANTTPLTYTVTLANTSSFTVDQIVQIGSTDYYGYGGGTYNIAKGEIKRIRSIVANTSITFTEPVMDTYTTGNGASVYPINFVNNIFVQNLNIQGSNIAGRGERGMAFQYVNGLIIKECTFNQQDIYQLQVSSCVNFLLDANKFHGVFYNGSTGTIFYGIALQNCSQWGIVRGNIGDKNRHLVCVDCQTTGQGTYGQPSWIEVHDNVSYDAMAGGSGASYHYEVHGVGRFINFHNNKGWGGYALFSIEGGSDITFDDNDGYGYDQGGILVGNTGSLVGNISNLKITNNRVSGYTGLQTNGVPAAVQVIGASITISNMDISGNTLTGTYNATAATGLAMSFGANTYVNCTVNGNTYNAGQDSSLAGVATVAGADGIVFTNNKGYYYRGGYSLSSGKCVVRNNHIEHASAQGTGFGYYSNGDRNIFQGNTARFINTTLRADTSSTNCLFVNNQSMQCTTGTFSNAGTGNTGRDNDAI